MTYIVVLYIPVSLYISCEHGPLPSSPHHYTYNGAHVSFHIPAEKIGDCKKMRGILCQPSRGQIIDVMKRMRGISVPAVLRVKSLK